MIRRLLLVVATVLLAQQTSLGSLLVGAECSEPCSDDTTRGHCSPVCASCACARHASPSALAGATAIQPGSGPPLRPGAGTAVPAEPHPGEIRHVPRLSPA